MKNILEIYRATVIDEIPRQSERFGFPHSLARWKREMDTIDVFMSKRSEAFEKQMFDILSVDETQNVDFTCYPNPSKGTFIIDLGSFADKISQIDIYDFMGRKVLTANNTKIECDLPKGIYFIKIGNSTQKIIIQ